MRRLFTLIATLLLLAGLIVSGGAAGKKHKRLRLTCDQAIEAISATAEQYRAQYNAKGYTIEPAPDGVLVGSGCRNIGKLTRQGRAFMADVHYSGDGSPPFPGETNPSVYAYHWQWDETVTRTKKGRIRTSVTAFTCTREALGPAPEYDIQVLPC